MPKLIVSPEPYDLRLLRGWKRGRLRRQNASKTLLGLLKKKARKKTKKTTRFFGEAYVANTTRHQEGFYGSFKWLTNPRFVGAKPLPAGPAEDLRDALHRHFGERRLRRLQAVVRQLHRRRHKALSGKLPTAPDLWLVDRRGRHRFIEVKLPGDSMAPHQLAGMAAIACILNASVEVIELRNEGRLFKDFCQATRHAV